MAKGTMKLILGGIQALGAILWVLRDMLNLQFK